MATARALLISLAALCLPAFANIPRTSLLIENSHPGVADIATIPHQADAPANPLIAPGLPACLCDEGRRTSITGKERDSETGLDFFGARYLSSAQGRFTSPDEPFADQHPSDPQSWNLFSYGRNNPLLYTDPNGRAVQVCLDDENGQTNCTTMSDPAYAKAYQNNPGVVAPSIGGNGGMGGSITCGGAICGFVRYQEESMSEDGFANGLMLGLARGLLALGESAVSDLAGSIKNVNPTRGNMNRVNCSIATDATLAGRPAVALPGGPTSIGVLQQQFGGQFVKMASKQSIDEVMRQLVQGPAR